MFCPGVDFYSTEIFDLLACPSTVCSSSGDVGTCWVFIGVILSAHLFVWVDGGIYLLINPNGPGHFCKSLGRIFQFICAFLIAWMVDPRDKVIVDGWIDRNNSS